MISIAIDGPSGAGKSTLARALSEKLGYLYLDTGAIYRTVALSIMKKGANVKNEETVVSLIPSINIEIRHIEGKQHMYIDGDDVTDNIRTNEISANASAVSAIPKIREFLLELQRDYARKNNVIMDGRDIGTVILPNATVKFFMTASNDARAVRRHKELCEKGEIITLDEVKRTMAERDKNDSTRKVAPAIPAADAIMLDNSGTFEETIEKALEIIRSKI